MRSDWLKAPYTIHVPVAQADARAAELGAAESGATIVHLDLAGVTDRPSLGLRIAHVFHFPMRTESLDSALDWMSDLEWLGPTDGYLILAEGLDSVKDSVVEAFTGILPFVVDRWRSQPLPYVVFLLGAKHRNVALDALGRSNLELQAYRNLPWARPDTGPVLIEDHGTL